MTGVAASGRIAANGPQQAEAVELRHHHVCDHEIEAALPQALERVLAVHRGFDQPVRAQQPREVLAHVGVVVGHQDRARFHGRAFGLGGRGRRGLVAAQPAHRFLDESLGPQGVVGPSGLRPRGLEALLRQVRLAILQRHAE
jgi:hypothetical protein